MRNIIILLIIIASLCIVMAFLVYAVNRSKYYYLLKSFQEKYDFPAPYSFHCLVGFSGAFPMACFFLGIKDKKKVYFLTKNHEAYDFFNDENTYLINWMRLFYYLSLTSFTLFLFLILMGAIIKIKETILPYLF